MIKYIIKRLLSFIPTVFLISVVAFIIIQLPPGSWIDTYIAQLDSTGQRVDPEVIETLKIHYGIDKPIYVGYFKWVSGWPRMDFGRSFLWQMPVIELIKDQLLFTVILSVATLCFAYAIAIPIATYAATHQYSIGDNFATLAGFIGLSIPNFTLAFVLMYIFYKAFGISPGGLVSPEFQNAAWSIAKLLDFFRHLWIPIIVIGTAGTAGTIRVLRATLLDELGKDYIKVARAKGLSESRVVVRHALRIAANPIVSRIMFELPAIISGSTITATVLSLPVLGGILLASLQNQDMYVAGTIILFQSMLVVVGALISDILLAIVDPRIRYQK
jgi:peptide/nickel transport system permease protein